MNFKILLIIVFFAILQEFIAQRDSLLLQTKYCPGIADNRIVLRGIIYDAQSNEELPNAAVFVKGTKVATLSDAKGLFALDLTTLLDSAKTLTIMGVYVGYAIKEIEINRESMYAKYFSIPMVSNSGISCPGIDVSPAKKKFRRRKRG